MARVSGLVGEPANETEKAFPWTAVLSRRLPPVHCRHGTLTILLETEYQTHLNPNNKKR